MRVVGIDLGTTNSTISEIIVRPGVMELPQAEPIEVLQQTEQGDYFHTIVPSVVALEEGAPIVGEEAKRRRSQQHKFGLSQFQNLFWDCKNDIGTRRKYHRAPIGYQSPRDIAGHVLRFLVHAAHKHQNLGLDATVITIPASFQPGQRDDTRSAAEIAGINVLENGSLLDEPIAAYIAYMVSEGRRLTEEITSRKNLMVFDFGGGTCDVAIFHVMPPQPEQPIDIAPLSVSRYNRLGGGDIDRAIVADVLLAQLLEQNSLERGDLDFFDKEKDVIPSLLAVAESLKIDLCSELNRRLAFGANLDELSNQEAKKPGSYKIELSTGSEFVLRTPSLTLNELNDILNPFLDEDLLSLQEVSEYYSACSIFAPINAALSRAHLQSAEIDQCLVVGGSSLIPQVVNALKDRLVNAELLTFQNVEEMHTSVSRGAAYQALALALYDRGIFRTVTGSAINLRTKSGFHPLIEVSTDLPFPNDGWQENRGLMVPESSLVEMVPLRVELTDSENFILYSATWPIPAPVNRGAELLLRYRMDANQVFHLELSLAAKENEVFSCAIENPLTNVVNSNATRDKVLELEHNMRDGNMSRKEQEDTIRKLVDLEEELGHYEKAIGYLKRLPESDSKSNMLNRRAILYGKIGDTTREEKFYRQASKVGKSGAPLFNLALARSNSGSIKEGLVYIEQAVEIEPKPPYWVLRARLQEKNRDKEASSKSLDRAFALFDPVTVLSDFELGWYLHGAKLAKDEAREKEAKIEQERRNQDKASSDADGVLPELAAGLPTKDKA